MYIAFVYQAPTYFQVVFADSAMLSGIRLIPFEVCSMIAAFAVGWFITSRGCYQLPISCGFSLFGLCFGVFILFDADTSWAGKTSSGALCNADVQLAVWHIETVGILMVGGVGMGCLTGPITIALQASVEERDIGKDTHCLPHLSFS